MLRRIIGESQRRIVLFEFLSTIVYPLNKLILKIRYLRKIQKCLRVGDYYFFFRPFIFSDLVMLFSDWESYVKRVFKPRKGETVFDAGAHIGIYTLRAAKDVGEEGIVVGFEPDDENFRILQKNVQINRFKRVKLIKAALGKNDVKKVFHMAIDPLYSSLLPSRALNSREKKKVQVITLDRIVEKLKVTRIDWIKIDVEGGEMDVLEGGKKTFSDLVSKVLIETTNEKALRFLCERNFKIDRLFGIYYFASKKN